MPKIGRKDDMGENIGVVTHYFDKIGVAIIKLDANLKVGDKIKIKGHTTDIEEDVPSIQIDHEELEKAKIGQEVGIKVNDIVREGDKVYKA